VARALIVGSGMAAATTARVLGDAGVGVEVVEAGPSWGGQLRPAEANGVLYEPHGATSSTPPTRPHGTSCAASPASAPIGTAS